MSWNYRVMRHRAIDYDGGVEEALALHEVYYKDGQTTDGDVGYSANAVAPVAEDLEGLRFLLTEMLKALEEPILEYK